MNRDREKKAAARAAVKEVQDGMLVGLGTGSTVAFAIEALAERYRSGLKFHAVATSLATESLALSLGFPMLDFAKLAAVNLCIDGVDEIDGAFRAVKGAGGAMLREKIVAESATRMIAIADSSKAVEQLGQAAIPVEILDFALASVSPRIEELGGRPILRTSPDGGTYQTDQGNPVLDCLFDSLDATTLNIDLSQIPGVLGHGLFLTEIDALYLGLGTNVERRENPISGRQSRSRSPTAFPPDRAPGPYPDQAVSPDSHCRRER